MFIEGDLGDVPAGYAVTSGRSGEDVMIQIREFTSTEDGQHFIQRLEGIPNKILQLLPSPIHPSQVDHMLAVCRRDGKADVHVNTLELRALLRTAMPVEAGADVMKNDIADVERLELGVSIPDIAGLVIVFSVG